MDQTPEVPAEVIDRPGPASESSKILAALGYVLVVPAIIALFLDPYKTEKFVRFHAFQAIALWLAAMVLGLVPFVGVLVGFAAFVYAIFLAVKTWGGEYVEIPVLYGFIKSYVEG